MNGVETGTKEEAERQFLAACAAWDAVRNPPPLHPDSEELYRGWYDREWEARFKLACAALQMARHMGHSST